MNKKFFIVFVVLAFALMLLPSVLAAVHGINGYIEDSDDGVEANGAVVVFFVETRPTEILTDVVGTAGNSGVNNLYSINDVSNFPTPWQDGDKVVIMIMKDEYHGAVTEVILSGTGNQQAPNTKLGQCEGSMCSFCGDGYCDELCNETLEICPQDCGGEFCGDFICGPTEDCLTCPLDCPSSECGDGLCDCPENLGTCPEDCAVCDYDNVCDYGETAETCPDCIINSCGNAQCEPLLGETEESCPSDCMKMECGNGICEIGSGESVANCPSDCKGLLSKCGNKQCEGKENSINCCYDCGCVEGKCVKNKCTQCCLIGICKDFLKICWYWFVLGILIIAAGVGTYFAVKKKKKQAERAKRVAGKAFKHFKFKRK